MPRISVPIRLRWSDLDAYGHVNNAEMLRLLEEARIIAFWSDGVDPDADTSAVGASTAVLDSSPGAGTLSLLARQEIEYLAPIAYQRPPLDIQLWISRLGGASLDVCYEVWSPTGTEPRTIYARAMTVLVLVDAATGVPRRIDAVERAAWSPFLDEPLAFSRRR